MTILSYHLHPHILYNRNEEPKPATIITITDLATSIAKSVLELYPSRVRLYEVKNQQ